MHDNRSWQRQTVDGLEEEREAIRLMPSDSLLTIRRSNERQREGMNDLRNYLWINCEWENYWLCNFDWSTFLQKLKNGFPFFSQNDTISENHWSLYQVADRFKHNVRIDTGASVFDLDNSSISLTIVQFLSQKRIGRNEKPQCKSMKLAYKLKDKISNL